MAHLTLKNICSAGDGPFGFLSDCKEIQLAGVERVFRTHLLEPSMCSRNAVPAKRQCGLGISAERTADDKKKLKGCESHGIFAKNLDFPQGPAFWRQISFTQAPILTGARLLLHYKFHNKGSTSAIFHIEDCSEAAWLATSCNIYS